MKITLKFPTDSPTREEQDYATTAARHYMAKYMPDRKPNDWVGMALRGSNLQAIAYHTKAGTVVVALQVAVL
jgi:hypothetical protein